MGKIADTRVAIQPFDLEGVQLLYGPLKSQFNQTKDFYYAIPNDNILKDFRLQAGLPAPGEQLGGIYSRDHSSLTFGQWLSAFARMYKVTGDTAVRDKAVYLMEEWAKTLPEEWPPQSHYTYDKLVCGLVDLYKYARVDKAVQYLERITKLAEKKLDRTRPYGTGSEWYTLSENLYRAYEITGNKLYLEFAKVWEYTEYWGHFARKEDIFTALKNSSHKIYHAYSHVNTLSGAAMAYKIRGERHYLDTLIHAYQFLQDTQCTATGGYGPYENLIIPNGLAKTLNEMEVRFHEETSCGSWAAFKLARYLMTFTGEARYGDWIERLVYNSLLAMPPVLKSGLIMYGSQLNIYGSRKSWMMDMAWHCCTGTLPQAVTEYHNLIYFHDQENLYVNLYVPSKVEWNGPDCKVTVVQDTRYPEEDTVLIHIQLEVPSRFGLRFRVPQWAKNGVTVKVNNLAFETATVPGKWASIDREWSHNDTVTLKFDLSPRIEPLTGFVSPVAVFCGPVVMVATTDPRGIPTDRDLKDPVGWLKPSKNGLEYSSPMQAWNQEFCPYYKTKASEPYRMYFDRPDGVSISPEELVFRDAASGGRWLSKEVDHFWLPTHLIYYAQTPGSYFEGKFNGMTLVWEGFRTEDGGIAQVDIDGKKAAEVDQYGYTGILLIWHRPGMTPSMDKPPFSWSISGLDKGEHTIRVTILPHKNPASEGTRLNVRKLVVHP